MCNILVFKVFELGTRTVTYGGDRETITTRGKCDYLSNPTNSERIMKKNFFFYNVRVWFGWHHIPARQFTASSNNRPF